MSLAELTVEEVEELLEGHPFKRNEYRVKRYDYATKSYVATGEVIPERYDSIVEGDASWYEFEELPREGIVVEGLGLVTLESQYGGEGMGDEYYIVLRVTEGDTVRFFRKNGWHASHDGSYLDGSLDEVKPVDRVVTFYE